MVSLINDQQWEISLNATICGQPVDADQSFFNSPKGVITVTEIWNSYFAAQLKQSLDLLRIFTIKRLQEIQQLLLIEWQPFVFPLLDLGQFIRSPGPAIWRTLQETVRVARN